MKKTLLKHLCKLLPFVVILIIFAVLCVTYAIYGINVCISSFRPEFDLVIGETQDTFILSQIDFQDNYTNIKNQLSENESFIDLYPDLSGENMTVYYFGNEKPVIEYEKFEFLNSYLDNEEDNVSLYANPKNEIIDSYGGFAYCFYDQLHQSGNITITEGRTINIQNKYVHGDTMEIMVDSRSELPLNTTMYLWLNLRDDDNKQIVVPCQIVGKYELNYPLPFTNNFSTDNYATKRYKKQEYIFIPNIADCYDITKKIGGEVSETTNNTLEGITLMPIYSSDDSNFAEEICNAVNNNKGIMLHSINSPFTQRYMLWWYEQERMTEYLLLTITSAIIFIYSAIHCIKKTKKFVKEYKEQNA